MSKAYQQNLIYNLNVAFGKDIHFGVVKACGIVSADAPNLNPNNIANHAVKLYEQSKGAWEVSTSIRE